MLSVLCYVVAASGKPTPPTPDPRVFLVPHPEDPRLCAYSLGFMGVGREGRILQLDWGASTFLLLMLIVTPVRLEGLSPTDTCFFFPFSLHRTLDAAS